MIGMRVPIRQLGNSRAWLPCLEWSVAGVTGACLAKVYFLGDAYAQSLCMQETPAYKGDPDPCSYKGAKDIVHTDLQNWVLSLAVMLA